MKNINIRMSAMAASIIICSSFAASCDKNPISQDEPAAPDREEYVSFTVNADSPSTKAIAGTSDENRVADIQVFVYRVNPGYSDDGVLETCTKANGTSATVKCTVGKKKIYVLANSPEISDIAATDIIDEQRISLADDARNKFQMCGIKTVDIGTSTGSVEVPLKRYAARVRVKSIVCNFEDYYEESSFVPVSLTLINVMTMAYLSEYWIAPSQEHFVNKGAFSSSSVDGMVRSTISGVTLSSTGTNTYNTVHSLYAYANSSSNTAHANTWAPVCTRLVLEAQIDGITYYYPVNIPGIEANHSYEIDALTITKVGSKSPDIPVESTTCSFSVTVTSWDEVNITDGINI